jgi:hypothetical protein
LVHSARASVEARPFVSRTDRMEKHSWVALPREGGVRARSESPSSGRVLIRSLKCTNFEYLTNSAVMTLRSAPELLSELKARARSEGRSTSTEVIHLVQRVIGVPKARGAASNRQWACLHTSKHSNSLTSKAMVERSRAYSKNQSRRRSGVTTTRMSFPMLSPRRRKLSCAQRIALAKPSLDEVFCTRYTCRRLVSNETREAWPGSKTPSARCRLG